VQGLVISDLTVEYSSAGYLVRPLDGFDLVASSGEMVILLGPSGCGKTTLLSCLAGILSPTRGSIRVDDLDITRLGPQQLTDYRRRTVGIAFQGFKLVPSLTAAENVAAPLRLAGIPARTARARAKALLEQFGLGDRLDHRPGRLSGGQQQRVAIARALAHDPPVLLADEPTAQLDYIQVEGVLRALRELARPGRLVVVATHDQRLVPLADRVVDLAARTVDEILLPEKIDLSPGQVLFEQGSRGELIFVVDDGSIDLVRSRADGTEEFVHTAVPGEYFGELAPLLGFPRAATARARTPAAVTGYPVSQFRRLVGIDPLSLITRSNEERPAPC
jgi:putative ABC transport system ATP-binding protein